MPLAAWPSARFPPLHSRLAPEVMLCARCLAALMPCVLPLPCEAASPECSSASQLALEETARCTRNRVANRSSLRSSPFPPDLVHPGPSSSGRLPLGRSHALAAETWHRLPSTLTVTAMHRLRAHGRTTECHAPRGSRLQISLLFEMSARAKLWYLVI